MADPFRLRLMKALTAQIKSISKDDGFNFDLGDYDDADTRPRERVYRGRDIFGSTDEAPLVAVLEDPRSEPSENGSDARSAANKFRVIIQGFCAEDQTGHPLDDAYLMSADIIQALAAAKRPSREGILGMGNRVTAMNIGQPVHRPGKDAISDPAYWLVGVTFTIIEKLDDPYA